MLDIEAIINRHLTDSKMEGKTFHEGHITVDLHNAIEEIKRLRAEVDTERAAVVAWLREVLAEASLPLGVSQVFDAVVDTIERGEHRREEEK